MPSTEDHLEHAQHAQHAAHDPFDRVVAMTMSIIAAVLAVVTLLSHRSHNETLRLQAEGNRYQTEANVFKTEASDQWSYYQAKKNRQVVLDSSAEDLEVLTRGMNAADTKASSVIEKKRSTAKRYKDEADKIEIEARELEKEMKDRLEKSKESLEESHKIHHKADRYDIGELGVELALVLSSVAVLTKRRPYWYMGILFGALGFGVAMTGLML